MPTDDVLHCELVVHVLGFLATLLVLLHVTFQHSPLGCDACLALALFVLVLECLGGVVSPIALDNHDLLCKMM
jgi:hypothetical protein